MSNLVTRMDRLLYPGVKDNWDDEAFRAEILNHVTGESVVLDLGAGAGIVRQMNFKGLAKRVCGVDLDERVTANPYLDEGLVASGERIPYSSETFDVVFADNVLEHLESPQRVFGEVHRVLKPGGVFLVKTPNRRHYMPLLARLTPHSFHRFVNKLRGRESVDTFPTLYRANTPEAILAHATESGFVLTDLLLIESRPEYLRISAPTYLAGWAYQRIVSSTSYLARFRVVLIAAMRKP